MASVLPLIVPVLALIVPAPARGELGNRDGGDGLQYVAMQRRASH
jgi:hypothetical protein